MKNIVVAAGYATRLGELTKNFPKPLLEIGENTILGRMLDDIDQIDDVDEHIIITKRNGRKISTTPTPLPLWMMGRRQMRRVWGRCVICCLRWISSRLMTTY